MRIAAYVPDLMDRSKVAAAGDVTFVNRPEGLAGVEADLVVVDLMRPGVLEALAGVSGRVIGFARHTEPALMAAAQAAGCDVVLPEIVVLRPTGRAALPAAEPLRATAVGCAVASGYTDATAHRSAAQTPGRRGLWRVGVARRPQRAAEPSAAVARALPAGVADGAGLEEQAVVGAGEGGLLGHVETAALDRVAGG